MVANGGCRHIEYLGCGLYFNWHQAEKVGAPADTKDGGEASKEATDPIEEPDVGSEDSDRSHDSDVDFQECELDTMEDGKLSDKKLSW
jgi:hypothetical protein